MPSRAASSPLPIPGSPARRKIPPPARERLVEPGAQLAELGRAPPPVADTSRAPVPEGRGRVDATGGLPGRRPERIPPSSDLSSEDWRHPSLRAIPLEGLPGCYRIRVATDVRLIYRPLDGNRVEIMTLIDREDLQRYIRQAKTRYGTP
jgi:hypothetical protein